MLGGLLIFGNIPIKSRQFSSYNGCAHWGEAGGPPSALEGLTSQRDAAYVARRVGQVANKLTLMAGATPTNLTSPIQRFQRDINSGITHVSLVWEEAAEAYGRGVWELPPKRG